MRDLSYAVALAFYALGFGVLQVPNPKRIIASRILLILGALSASGASIMWLMNVDKFWIRTAASLVVFGLIGWGTVEAFRFAGHTEPLKVKPLPVPQSVSSSPQEITVATPTPPTPRDEKRVPVKSVDQSKEKAPTGLNQTMTNSPGGMQAGRDIRIGQKPSPVPTEKDKKP